MSVKRVCDCCGKEITKSDFMVFNLLPFKTSRGFKLENDPVSCTSNQELCDSCAAKLCKSYEGMKNPVYRPGGVRRFCTNCGQENDHDIVCPICGMSTFKFTEEE
jgi:hypothetical protein